MSKALKYLPVLPSIKKDIANTYKDNKVSEHLEDLYNLIDYQMRIILEQTHVIVAEKHKDAWKQYNKSAQEYIQQSKKYFTKQELDSRSC